MYLYIGCLKIAGYSLKHTSIKEKKKNSKKNNQ